MQINKFLKLSTWQMIISSRLIAYKNSKQPWCKERREVCKNCQYNTKNKTDFTFKEKFLMFIQLSKAICSACGCSISKKILIKQAICGLEEIGLTPKWTKIK